MTTLSLALAAVSSIGLSAAPDSDARRAVSLLQELAKGAPADKSPALDNSREALRLAKARALPPGGSKEHSLLLGRNALIWAQVARDERRARVVRQQANRLEEEVSQLRARLSRRRAVVEQARAKVGRATKALQQATGAVKPTLVEGDK